MIDRVPDVLRTIGPAGPMIAAHAKDRPTDSQQIVLATNAYRWYHHGPRLDFGFKQRERVVEVEKKSNPSALK